MKNKLFKIFSALILVSTIVFFSCEKEDLIQDLHQHDHVDKNKISFKEFLVKTKIKAFKQNISISNSENGLQSRLTDNINFTGFIIDTTTVKQLIKDNGITTFTLPVVPIPFPNNENLYYNIVFYKFDTNYEWSILEFEKNNNEVYVTEILNETTNNNLVNFSARLITVWTTGPIYHCTKTGECADGPCDLCNLCVSFGVKMGSIEIPDREFESIQQTPQEIISQGGAGGGGNAITSSINVAINNFKNTLTSAQLAVYNTNKTDFDNYLKNNSISFPDVLGAYTTNIDPQAEQFVIELIDDMINFPLPEGEDNGDEFDYNDYSNIFTTAQTLPGRNSFYSHFPKVGTNGMPSSQVYQLIGGHPYQAHIAGNPNYQNACALRVSRALNYSGNPIPVFKNNNNEQKTEKGDDNLNYILDASSLLAYMKKTFPNSSPIHLVNKTPTEIKTALKGKWGIYIMIPKNRATFGASGHADFWSNTGCLSGCYFDKAKEVYFWELF